MRVILHIDFNSFFASVEQQANPRLRGKPIGVTGGDRETRTVLATASIEAKALGVKTGMQIWEAKRVCPEIIIVQSNHEKYLSVTTKFLNILKDYSDKLEIFSIDEAFLDVSLMGPVASVSQVRPRSFHSLAVDARDLSSAPPIKVAIDISQEIKQRLKVEVGEKITCSIGISYNKLMAKLAGSLKKPDGLVIIPDQKTALEVLDKVELDDICGIGFRTKRRLFNMGIKDFKSLRKVPLKLLLASFKSYGEVLYNMARGIDDSPVRPFFQREEVKSIGHRHTIDHDTDNLIEIRQVLLKMGEMVAFRLRNKNLMGKTIHLWYRSAFDQGVSLGGGSVQKTIQPTCDGLEISQVAWEIFLSIWDKEKIRMIGVSVSNLKSTALVSMSLLPEDQKKSLILKTMDKVNNKFGDWTIQRGVLLDAIPISRKPNPFLSDRRFKI